MFSILEMYFEIFGSKLYEGLLVNELKAIEVVDFPNTKRLHHNGINYGCVVVNVSKVLNRDLQLPHALRAANMLLEENGA